MTGHIDAETLARFRQGDLGPRRNHRIHAHLAGCARCSDLNEDLAGVTTLLAAAEPPPIPEHLAARIQTALATEAARRVTLTAGAAAGGIGTEAGRTAAPPAPEQPQDGRPARPGGGHRRPRLPRLSSPVALRTVAAAAAAVVITGGAYELAHHVGGSSSPSAASGTGSPKKAPANGVGSSGLAAGVPTSGPPLRYRHDGHQDSITPVTTSTNFVPTELGSQVSRELARSQTFRTAGPNVVHSSASGSASQSGTLGNISVSSLQDCVNRLAAGHQVLLVDVAHYRGALATVIVTRTSPVSPEQVWVVGAGCSAARSDVLTRVTLAPGG